MRVVIVRNAYSWQYGGAEQFAFNLAKTLGDEEVEATVVSRVPELIRHCQRAGIPTYRNLWLKNQTQRRWMLVYYLLYPVLVAQYMWVMQRQRADLLVVSSRDDQIFGTMAAHLLGTPVVWFDHADMKHIVAKPFRFLSRSYYWAMRHAERVIMTSSAERELITKGLPLERQSNFVLINNGAMPPHGEALDRPKGVHIVAYIGRLDVDKGLLDLAEAASEVVGHTQKVAFWIAGKGPDESKLVARLEELGISKYFRLLGHLDNVGDLLATADVFVYPTHHDAAPLAPVEAMLAGVPVIASRIGGIPEMIPESAGILVPAKSPHELAAAITKVITDQKLLGKLRQGAVEAGPAHTFAHVTTDSYLPLFRELLEERP